MLVAVMRRRPRGKALTISSSLKTVTMAVAIARTVTSDAIGMTTISVTNPSRMVDNIIAFTILEP